MKSRDRGDLVYKGTSTETSKSTTSSEFAGWTKLFLVRSW